MQQITNWFKQHLADPQVVYLAAVLVVSLLIIVYAGNMLAPVLAGIVIAYLLEGITRKLTRLRVPRPVAVWLVFIAFLLFVVLVVFGLLPTLYGQLTEMVRQIPSMLTRGQAALTALPEKYPELFSVAQVEELIGALRAQLTAWGQAVVASTLSGAASLITWLIYLILMPILIFFFLRDKARILNWFIQRMPRDSQLARAYGAMSTRKSATTSAASSGRFSSCGSRLSCASRILVCSSRCCWRCWSACRF